jgi:predicted amidohydrolase YtcJ
MRRAVLGALLLGGFACATAPAPREPGPVRIVNGRFSGHPEASALTLRRGRISSFELPKAPDGAQVVDAEGGVVLPGFRDSHVHLMNAGFALDGVQIAELDSLDAVQAAIKKFADDHPEERWIEGRGWQYSIVPQGMFPSRHDLDAAVPDRPALLGSYDGHTSWANTKALELAKIDSTTPDPANGKIVREADGTPQGALLEGAGSLVGKVIPPLPKEKALARLRRVTHDLCDIGVTFVDDIERDPEMFELLGELLAKDELPIRVRVSLPIDGDLVAFAKLRERYKGDRLSFGFLKGFVDGVVESKTAYLVEPYVGSDSPGKPILGPERLTSLVKRAHAAGFPVALHAIGDGAVRISLDAFEAAEKEHPEIHLAHRIEHIEVISHDDLPRFARLGVTASMQPFHALPEPPTEVWSTNLGPERLKRTFAWRDLLDAKAHLIFGSDLPVASANPLWGLAVATTRKDPKGDPPGGWNAHEAISMAEAIRAYTVEPALLAGWKDVGALEPGQLADIAILSSDVDLARPETLWKGKVVHTIVGGFLEH